MVKEHAAAVADASKTIGDAEARLARVAAERSRLEESRTAAVHKAADLRRQAQRAMALVAVGDDDEGGADRLLADAAMAERKAADLESTLAGLAEIEATANAAIAGARGRRLKAIAAAIDERAAVVTAEYEQAAAAYIAVTRQVLAVERIRSGLGDQRKLLRVREVGVPASATYTGRLHGEYNDLMYLSRHEYADGGPLFDAIEAELDAFGKAGLEI